MQPRSNGSSIAHVVESLLFVGGPPLNAAAIAEAIGGTDEESIIQSIAELNLQYHQQGRPYEIRRAPAGFHMILRSEFLSIARRLYGKNREVRLSIAALDVLAIIAYRQPVDIQTVDSIRGLDSGPVVRLLRKRNLVELDDAKRGSGRAPSLRTTRRFLDLFHLHSLDELPRVQDLERG